MSTGAVTLSERQAAAASRVWDFVEMSKPRIAVLVLVVVATAGIVGSLGAIAPGRLIATAVGTLLIAASACAANQWLERQRDARMPRTANRPAPSGRVQAAEALGYVTLTLLTGVALTLAVVGVWATFWGVATWVLYVAVYTPLKTRSIWNTAVGAAAGAMPVFIGWSASGAAIDHRCLALFALLFFWQFPHFMAIAWLYRRDYQSGGFLMATVTEPSGRLAGWWSIGGALAMLPLAGLILPAAPWPVLLCWGGLSVASAVGMTIYAWRFFRRRDDSSARRLLWASLICLPLMLAAAAAAVWGAEGRADLLAASRLQGTSVHVR